MYRVATIVGATENALRRDVNQLSERRAAFDTTRAQPPTGKMAGVHAAHTRNENLSMRPKSPNRTRHGEKRRRTSSRPTLTLDHLTDDHASSEEELDEMDDGDVYDPDQPPAERRKLQRGLRDLLKVVTENSEEYMEAGTDQLREAIEQANALSKQVRQTSEATIDSRLLVSTTDLSYRKTLRLTQGSLSQGIDVDELVSKCAVFMRQGNELSEEETDDTYDTHQPPARNNNMDGDEDEDTADDGDMMNWAHLGAFACLPSIRRPALPGFMLGPLSVERKARKVVKRSAPFRPNSLTEIRPEVLDVDDLAKKENDLAATCSKILQRLINVQAQIQETVAAAMDEDMSEEEQTRIMHNYGLRSTGGIDLMRFVTNPKSFGQTVENLFYVSFLIRDGKIAIDFDEFDLPAVAPVTDETSEHSPKRVNATKNQAILSMDMETWQEIVMMLELGEPMIEHRQEPIHGGPGARSWYS